MKFQVPQFIDVEDKIFGPLTLKQFIYVAGGAGICVLCFLFLPFYFAIIPAAAAAGLSLALAFYKINNKPFIFVLEAAVKYFLNPKLYVWKKEEQPINTAASTPSPDSAAMNFIPNLGESKLKDLSWNLNTKKDVSGEVEEDKVGDVLK